MVCQNCSAQLHPEEHFCPSCGVPVDKPSTYSISEPGINLITEGPTTRKLPSRLVGGAALISFVGLLLVLVVTIPRVNSANFLKGTHEQLAETSGRTGKVNQSLEAIYNFVTATETGTTESSLPSEQKVAGATTTADEFNVTAAPTLYSLKSLIEKAPEKLRNQAVLGFNTSEDDPLKSYRDLRDLATNANLSTREALESAAKLSQAKERSDSASPKITADIVKVSVDTNKYLSEADKTADYYETYTDSYIDLTTVITDSLNGVTLSQVNGNLVTAKKIQSNLADVSESSLPAEIDSFHANILTEVGIALEFLDTYTTLAQSKDPAAADKALVAVEKWLTEEKSLIIKLQTNQINFWKKNETLNGFSFLSSQHNETLKELESAKEKAKPFVLF